jgi:hypothetical protein
MNRKNSFKIITLLLILGVVGCDKIARIQEVEIRNVDCNNIAAILEEVYDIDQEIRKTTTDFQTFVKKDHENLEQVVSILEKCGMPTLAEINQKQMDAIWLVLHHSPQEKYVKKYLPLIEKAAIDGDIRLNALATIKDRILSTDGANRLVQRDHQMATSGKFHLALRLPASELASRQVKKPRRLGSAEIAFACLPSRMPSRQVFCLDQNKICCTFAHP